jgi:phosphoesterase RecJ-like protein
VPLLTGLVTDTLGFRTSNVTANTISLAHTLIGGGANLAEITERTLDTRSINKVCLWKYALASVELYEGGVIAANVTHEDARRAGLSEVSDAGLAQWLIRTNEAVISITFKETLEGRVEISMRSKPGFDVSKIAFEVGGGGHKQAAGATVDGPLEEARKRILPMLTAEAKAGKYRLG